MNLVVDIGWIEYEAKMIVIQCFRENEYIGLLGGWRRWRRRNSTVDSSSVFSGMSTASYNPLCKTRIYSDKRKIIPKLRTLVDILTH